ncbi:hypothetical protein SEA_ARAXXI_12 [Microbacterium phage Araxxi]|uniref:Uncharacterized protein n=1 Tax=Microbacterium phage Araxxi TaxID=2590948 RepID=A0A516KT11_9CAUD|nr:hypothetical protein HWC57_gp12 [Microbacterium phage Araxxi]QDP44831.1 hypothetical protein SEA_ARAXXI_12 [Microbacterium phage Araxxi]
MKIDCGICGAEDKVWATKKTLSGQAVFETLEVGRNYVECRGCKQQGYVDLDVTCANCHGNDLWRWPNRSMDTNTRRWFCRDCHHVTECHNEAVMYQSDTALPTVQSRGRTTPNCQTCSAPTVMRDYYRMVEARCKGPTAHEQTYPLHKQKRADIKKKGDPAVNSTTFVGTNGNITYNMTTTTNTNTAGWTPRVRSFQEILAQKINKVMHDTGCSAHVAEMVVRNEMEALDDEAILCI